MTLLRDSNLFIVLDLAHGYLQMPLAKEAREKTAFITLDDTGEFTRMIFGLTNAPFYFSKLMKKTLEPLRKHTVLFYLDDVLIAVKHWKDLLEHLTLVFEARLTVKLEKCEFLQEKVSYLGMEISAQGVEPGWRNVQVIENYPPPANVHQLRRYLGLLTFFRRFVPEFARKAQLLYDLLKSDVRYQWMAEEENAFVTLKTALTTRPILQLYDPTRETELHTDAAATGLAAMLLQHRNDKKFHLVYAISRSTSPAEKNYHSSKLEMLAIIWAVTRLRNFLINIKFTIIMDFQALIYVNVNRTKNPQFVRWQYLLSEYYCEIRYHRPGDKMAHVDALSRVPHSVGEDTPRNGTMFSVVNERDEIQLYQISDEQIQTKIKILHKNEKEPSPSEKSEVKGYILKHGLLYHHNGDDLKLFIPKAMRKSLVVRFHDLENNLVTYILFSQESDRLLSYMQTT